MSVDTSVRPAPPWWRDRSAFAGALLLGVLALVLSGSREWMQPNWPTDLDQWYYAARAMWTGRDPYSVVGPTAEFRWEWPLYYPISTVLFVAPLSFLSVQAARISFATIGGAVLGFAIGRDQFRRIGLVFSAAFMIAIWRDQWSPFILAAFTLPAVALAIFAKPNLAVVYLAGRRTKREWTWILSLSAAIVAVSTAIRPTWMTEWWGALSTVPYVVAPVMRPGGFLLLAAVLRWKRPDARVLLALACVPQTPSLYDLLPLFIIARTTREVALLTLLTNVLFGLVLYDGPFADFNSYAHRLGNLATFVVYLPMLLLVLRRPNVSADAPSPTLSPTESAWRARLHALSTVDAMLLLVNAASAALLAWVSTSSPRP